VKDSLEYKYASNDPTIGFYRFPLIYVKQGAEQVRLFCLPIAVTTAQQHRIFYSFLLILGCLLGMPSALAASMMITLMAISLSYILVTVHWVHLKISLAASLEQKKPVLLAFMWMTAVIVNNMLLWYRWLKVHGRAANFIPINVDATKSTTNQMNQVNEGVVPQVLYFSDQVGLCWTRKDRCLALQANRLTFRDFWLGPVLSQSRLEAATIEIGLTRS